MDEAAPRLFGSAVRTAVLMLVAALGDSYPRELARLLDAPLLSVQRVVDRLEAERILVTGIVGGVRRVSLNPSWLAARELLPLLLRLSQAYPGYEQALQSVRRRPGRRAKAL